MNKKKKKIISPLEIKYEKLDQYDSNWNEELLLKKKTDYAFYIWTFLIDFSYLEHEIDIALAELINEKNHNFWYVITKDLETFDKISLFYNSVFPYISFTENKKKIEMLDSLIKKLQDITIFRNKIAHWKWNTLDKDGYIRVDAKTSKENGLIVFRKYKITLPILRKSIKDMQKLTEEVSNFLFSL